MHWNTPPEIWSSCLSGVYKLTQSAHLLACPLCLAVKDCASAVKNADDLHTQDQTAEPLCQGKALSKRFKACVCAWWRQTEHSWSIEEEARGQEEVRELLVVMILVFRWLSIAICRHQHWQSFNVLLICSMSFVIFHAPLSTTNLNRHKLHCPAKKKRVTVWILIGRILRVYG